MKTLIVFFLSLSAVTGYSQTITTSDYNVVTANTISDQKIDTFQLFTSKVRSKHEINKKVNYLKVVFPDSVYKLKNEKISNQQVPFPPEVLKRIKAIDKFKPDLFRYNINTVKVNIINTVIHRSYSSYGR